MAAEDAGDRAGGDVVGAAERGSDAGAESAQSAASELRIRDQGPLPCIDQSDAGRLQTGATAAAVPPDGGSPESNPGSAAGELCAVCADERGQLEYRRSHSGKARAAGQGRYGCRLDAG